MGPWQSCHRWRDAWPSLSLGARTQVELLDVYYYYLVAGCFVGSAASKRAAWLGSMPQSRRYIAKGCPHVRHPWLRRERFGMMRPSWGLEAARWRLTRVLWSHIFATLPYANNRQEMRH